MCEVQSSLLLKDSVAMYFQWLQRHLAIKRLAITDKADKCILLKLLHNKLSHLATFSLPMYNIPSVHIPSQW